MKQYISEDEWNIIETEFHPENNMISESLMSIGNARLGQRANMPEGYSGKTLQGSYIAGIYYPDKTKVGWWKNGYPEYFAKVLNSCNWIGLNIYFNNEKIDLATSTVLSFRRNLDMQKGLLSRSCRIELKNNIVLDIHTERFYSFKRKNIGALEYNIQVVEGKGDFKICPYLDFDIRNEDSNYDENFWDEYASDIESDQIYVFGKTRKTGFAVGVSSRSALYKNNEEIEPDSKINKDSKVCQIYHSSFQPGDKIKLTKYAAIVSSFYEQQQNISGVAKTECLNAKESGYAKLKAEHISIWKNKWALADVQITNDIQAQQGIRFNIFHLNQTYDGSDHRLNIGPKGFTGEKYGGSTYWDTEAYCLPFYLFTADKEVSKNLLMYRYKHLSKAIENAEKLGFTNGAALYPMVTMNGEECHNEWEITFEEIHRNGAIAYAIYDYSNHFNDNSYLDSYGIHVLIAISKFWSQRVQFSNAKQQYVMLGVTGPNEYENNVNNNWYTNYIAKWSIDFTIQTLNRIKEKDISEYKSIFNQNNLEDDELKSWTDISNNMYFPEDKSNKIYLQQDGFLDKDLTPVKELASEHLPLNQKWSWDRILRSAYIKQADVLQGFYFFENDFTIAELERHYDFYEPLTVHESSLSPCVHAILVSKLERQDKAYELYLRTSRLDIDDYNNDTEDGLHITSMAGTWMTVVKGFGGARVKKGKLHFNPALPKSWNSITFKTINDGKLLKIHLAHDSISISNESSTDTEVFVLDKAHQIPSTESIHIDFSKVTI